MADKRTAHQSNVEYRLEHVDKSLRQLVELVQQMERKQPPKPVNPVVHHAVQSMFRKHREQEQNDGA